MALIICLQTRVLLPQRMLRDITIPDTFPDHSDSDDSQSQSDVNKYYSIQFLSYLIVQVFPFGAIMTHGLLHLNEYTLLDDTNAASESWNKVNLYLSCITLLILIN